MALSDFRPDSEPIAAGPFAATWESLQAGYAAPEWYRDAKFGIWAHWGPQCQPEAGDWYARHMYVQGHAQYQHHLKHYGHPADTGFIDIIGQWKAENWDPDALLDLYQRVGAKFFVAMANHHDNFDNYASRWHAWNSTRLGPMRDIVGIWAQKARARGLRFGVTNHSAHVWHWYQTAYGYDPEGMRRNERYDAWQLSRHDGRGRFWEGLDPQELYGGAVMPLPPGMGSAEEAAAWHEANDRVWNEAPPLANPIFVRNWFRRCRDLVDSYKPDLLYFDNFDLPLGQAGLDMAAHYYNSSLNWHGRLDVVLNTKELPPHRSGALVEDVERGYRADIEPHVWQTDTCIGDWHYNRGVFERRAYVPARAVVHRLCDVVAKNGVLLLNIPLRGDGTLDSEETAILEGVAGWMARFGDAIFKTRPWRVAGEGPTQVVSGQFGEAAAKPFTAEDIRFTTLDETLNAITLGRAGDKVTIASLAAGSNLGQGEVGRVQIVGDSTPLDFTRDDKGLHVEVPAAAGHDYGVALAINGKGLTSR